MTTLYLDCGMGAAGDMLTSALLELFDDRDAMVAELNGLGIPGVVYEAEKSEKCGIVGTHMHVLVHGEEEGQHHHHDHDHDHEHGHHHHSGMDQIRHWISHARLPEQVRKDVEAVYASIAAAESQVHGVPVDQIHFHEVGSLDALADVTAVCYLMNRLGVDQVWASPVHVGSGQVSCAHGILPVPAPATAVLLKGIPIYGGSIYGELCTPTGAALLKHFVKNFGNMPAFILEKTGYGMGKKNFPVANCVRALLGSQGDGDRILELSCNLDDMTGENIGFAMDYLLEQGALDVFTTAIGMKKNRPGVMLTVLCKLDDREKMTEAMFRCTTTLGVRETEHRRSTLTRHTETVETAYGPVRVKVSRGCGVERRKAEYDDLCRIAKENNITVEQIRKICERKEQAND